MQFSLILLSDIFENGQLSVSCDYKRLSPWIKFVGWFVARMSFSFASLKVGGMKLDPIQILSLYQVLLLGK